MSTTTLRALGALLLVPALATAQRPTLSASVKQYVAVDTPAVALTPARVIDGTGAAPKEDQMLIIRDGNIAAIDATAPYVNGPSPFTQMYALKDSADARRFVAFWADAGATSFKAYMNITRAELAAAVDEAHRRGLKITGHLCSVTYREAADLGIDDLEHGFFVATDFIQGKQPDVCPAPTGGMPALVGFDAKSPEVTSPL